VDKDSWHGLFDTQAGPMAGVSSLSKKRAFIGGSAGGLGQKKQTESAWAK